MPSRRCASPSLTLSARLAPVVAVAVFAAVVLALRIPAPAVAATPLPAGSMATPASLSLPALPLAQRRGGGFRSRRIPSNRPLSRNRPVARRNPNTGRALRRLSRTVLQALGIAFLLSFLFGMGPGGSPLGLLLLLGIVALVVLARRRRRQYGYR